MNSKTYKICYTAVLIAFGLVLPQVTHIVGGASGGTIFLPIHLSIFIATMVIGVSSGIATAIILPIMSFALTGMPSAVRLPYMIFELIMYAIIAGVLTRKEVSSTLSIATAQVVGRVALLGVGSFMYYIGAMNMGSASVIISGFIMGLPGIAIQLVLIPLVVKTLRRTVRNGNYQLSKKLYQ